MTRRTKCDLHLGKNTQTESCRFFEIGIARTASRSVADAVRSMGLRVRHGFASCIPCERDALEKYYQHRCDFDIYETCDYSGNISSIHWRQLAETRPEAKFILTTRPVEKWLQPWKLRGEVTRKRIEDAMNGKVSWPFIYRLHHFKMVGFILEEWERVFVEYHQEVLSFFGGSERLLVLNVFDTRDEEIWEKLSSFIGNTDVNKRQAFPFRCGRIRLDMNDSLEEP